MHNMSFLVLVVLTVSVTRIGTDSDNEVHYRQKRHQNSEHRFCRPIGWKLHSI